MKPLLLIDLDGPILDVRARHIALHVELVTASGGTPLEPHAYWEAKRRQTPEAQILRGTGLGDDAIRAVVSQRLELIETPNFLRLDSAWPWATAVLDVVRRHADIVVVTLRTFPDLVRAQLRDLGIDAHVDDVIAGPGDGSTEAKAQMVRHSGWQTSQAAWVGDTEFDILSGKELGCLTIAVTCGIRGRPLLEPLRPDAVVDDLRAVPAALGAIGWGGAEDWEARPQHR